MNPVTLTPRAIRERGQARYLAALEAHRRHVREAAEARERREREGRERAARQAAERRAQAEREANARAQRCLERERLMARVHREARALGIPEPAAREAGEEMLFPQQLAALADRVVGWRYFWRGTGRDGLAPADATVERIVQRYYTRK